jgi:2-hydroxy-6-oxonona-2,4-dienedioate hydrolase
MNKMLNLPDNVISNFVMVNGIRTHYVEAGSGDPLVLVHGAGPGASGWSGWRETIPVLAKHYHVYAIDTLGFGYTDKPTNIVYSDQASVDHLAGFLDVMCLDRIFLCGNSRGAYIAAKYMVDHPDRVRRLAMVSSGSLASAMGLDRRPDQMGGVKILEAFDGTPEGMRNFMKVIVSDTSKITDDLIASRMKIATLPGHDYARKSQNEYRKSLKTNPNEQQRFDLRHRLPKITIPMLLVWGAKDTFAPAALADDLLQALPNVKIVKLENSGHQAQNDESERFNEMVTEFFRQEEALEAKA